MSKVKLTKLELTTKDGKTVELTIDEAKDLHEQLHELFGAKTVYLPSAPIYIEPYRWPYSRPYWGVTCESNGTTVHSKTTGMTVSYKSD